MKLDLKKPHCFHQIKTVIEGHRHTVTSICCHCGEKEESEVKLTTSVGDGVVYEMPKHGPHAPPPSVPHYRAPTVGEERDE